MPNHGQGFPDAHYRDPGDDVRVGDRVRIAAPTKYDPHTRTFGTVAEFLPAHRGFPTLPDGTTDRKLNPHGRVMHIPARVRLVDGRTYPRTACSRIAT